MELHDPPTDAGEKETLEAFLDYYRAVVARKVQGLSEQDARKRLVPSATTPLGVVKHLADVERFWFQHVFAGRDVDFGVGSVEETWQVRDDETIDSLVRDYLNACDGSRAAVADAVPEAPARRKSRYTLRWILVHMIEETARHAGHLDILREQIDGVTGD